MKKIIFSALFIFFTFILLHSCNKSKRAAKKTDKSLYKEVTGSDYTYFQNGALLSAAAPSPHGSFKLRFNSTAQSALDAMGKLPTGNSFPNGSIIVKEVYSGSDISLYAVMKKLSGDINAGNGWLWAEYKTNGDPSFSVYKKGDGCTSCHSGSPNRDLTRTFDLH